MDTLTLYGLLFWGVLILPYLLYWLTAWLARAVQHSRLDNAFLARVRDILDGRR
ncbi:MAG: hypothetical protein AAGI34_00465 [Pseudomonadota bacterium]